MNNNENLEKLLNSVDTNINLISMLVLMLILMMFLENDGYEGFITILGLLFFICSLNPLGGRG